MKTHSHHAYWVEKNQCFPDIKNKNVHSYHFYFTLYWRFINDMILYGKKKKKSG